MNKNKLEKISAIKRRLRIIRSSIDDKKQYLKRNAVDEKSETETETETETEIALNADIAILNAEKIDLNIELDTLVKEVNNS